MSAGAFIKSKYAADNGDVYRIRIQPETAALVLNAVTNTAPAGAVDQEITARARGSRRKFGVTARKVSLEFTGALPDGYEGDPVEVPILTKTVFDGITTGQTGTYLGSPVAVISKTNEQVR